MSLLLASLLISALTALSLGDPSLLALMKPALLTADLLPPKPYDFGYDFVDGLGMRQHHNEVADNTGAVKGSYGYVDALGVSRLVEYTADDDGYKAVIRSNEPGTSGQNAADALFFVQSPPAAAVAQGLRPILPKIIA